MKLRFAVLLAALAAFAGTGPITFAQSTTDTAPHIHPAQVVSGKDHPELIPDYTAYRLFLLSAAVVAKPTPADLERQHGILRNAGLTGVELGQASVILADFKTKHDAI